MHDFFEFLGIQVRPGDHVSTRQDRGKTVPLGKKKKQVEIVLATRHLS